MKPNGEEFEFSEELSDGLSDESEEPVVKEELEILKSPLRRLHLFVGAVVKALLLTPLRVEEISFIVAPSLLKTRAIYFFGILRRLFFIGVFLFFFIPQFTREYITQKFMAVEKRGARECTNVASPWMIPAIQADYYGSWDGQASFQPNQAMYSFSLLSFSADMASYEKWMRKINIAIKKVGNAAKFRDLALNLVYWGSWTHVEPSISPDKSVHDQSVVLTGDPRYIMDSDFIQGTIGNVNIDCGIAFSCESYRRPTGELKMFFDINTLTNVAGCNETLNSRLLGYNPLTDGSTVTITVDVASLFATMVVANDVNGPNSMNKFVSIDKYTDFSYEGVEFEVYRKYDPVYQDMQPIYCLGPKGSNASYWNCLLKIGDSYGVPFFTHSGANNEYAQKCDCTTSAGKSDACNQFNFLSGVILHDYSTNSSNVIHSMPDNIRPFLPALEFFYKPPVNSPSTANQLAFYPAWAAVHGQGLPQYQDPDWRQNAYSFTQTSSFGTGSIIVFATSRSSQDYSVSPYKYQVRKGACSDSFSSPHFPAFYDNPWGDLSEKYMECLQTLEFSLFDSAGISMGNALLFVPPGIMTIMFAVFSAIAFFNTKKYVKELRAAELTGEPYNIAYHFHKEHEHEGHEGHEHHAHHAHHGPHHGPQHANDTDKRQNLKDAAHVDGEIDDRKSVEMIESVERVSKDPTSHGDFQAFHRRRMQELNDDEIATLLDPSDLTALILAEWRHFKGSD